LVRGGGRLNRGVVGGLGGLEYGVVFNELAAFEAGPGADERDEVGALTARQRSWAALISLNAVAIPAALEPGPLVTLVRCLTVTKVDSMGLDLP
jgi:hypothetical protein